MEIMRGRMADETMIERGGPDSRSSVIRPSARRLPVMAEQPADVGEPAGDGGGGGHGRAEQVGPAAGPLAALEVAVAGAGRPLAGGELVGVHGQAHAAPGLP